MQYLLLCCFDEKQWEALEIAKRIPTLPWGGAVEVRPLEPGPACAAPEGVRSTA